MTRIHPITRQRARQLRAEMTPQERLVWSKLRELNRMLGLHFRRQAPIGPFIADFADLGRRLVIEIDGGGHGDDHDQQRDAWLNTQGFQVLRFWNSDVSANIDGVMQQVLDTLGGELLAHTPPPRPSPTRGEGGIDPAPRGTTDRNGPPSPSWGGDGGGGHQTGHEAPMKRPIQTNPLSGNHTEASSPTQGREPPIRPRAERPTKQPPLPLVGRGWGWGGHQTRNEAPMKHPIQTNPLSGNHIAASFPTQGEGLGVSPTDKAKPHHSNGRNP